MNFIHHPISKDILQIAIPSIISNITVPLLGLVDVTIVGHLGAASYIGAIAVGGMLFNMIYWIFGFLRMGTGGMTSQAYGRQNYTEITSLLLRSLSIGLIMALSLILLQYPIRIIAFRLIEASPEVQALATQYFHICIWGAPATLCLYSFTGWFIGMQNTRFPMYIAIVQNLVNIGTSLLLVFGFNMKVEGVALGTLIAQYAGVIMALILTVRNYHHIKQHIDWVLLWERSAMANFFRVNRDIFLRTLCVVAVTVFFTSTGAAYGDVVLAVNTILMQLFTLYSYIMDGFAYAGEALIGKHIGAKQPKEQRQTVRYLFYWGSSSALIFTILYLVAGKGFLQILTDDATVIAASSAYFYWVLAIPVVGYGAFLMDGICIGATATHLMLRSMIVAAGTFFATYYCLHEVWGNHALWLAFILYLFLRGVMQAILGKRLIFPKIK